MKTFKMDFFDLDLYNISGVNWGLEFKLLRKSNFKAYLNMYIGEHVQLTQTKLNGKIKQSGLTPIGYRTIGIPARHDYCMRFNWFHKKLDGNQLLIFPKSGILEAVSFNGFDMFIVDIKETFLFQLINDLGYKHAENIFNDGTEQCLNLTLSFSEYFHRSAEISLREAMIVQYKKIGINEHHERLINSIVIPLLKYINFSNDYVQPYQRKRDISIKKAVELICSFNTGAPSIVELCRYSNVSERTLEYAFLEKYEISPIEFIKVHRLYRVKKHLEMAKEKGVKISTIAIKNGFNHSGQFALDFKNLFGVLPSEVLNKGKLRQEQLRR